MNKNEIGRVLAIALRSEKEGPMREVETVEAVANGGLVGDLTSEPDRGITFLSARQWSEVTGELEVELPWHTRRANVLIEAGGLGNLIGKTVTLGEVEVAVKGPSKPCGLMERLHPGLKAALMPDTRGGIYGRILRGGRIDVGDVLRLKRERVE
ncbi:MAG: MOSC domain-containing protein [Phycisphaerae bacterium]